MFRKINVICVDGLGGDPEKTFKKLKKVLCKKGYSVSLVPTHAFHSFEKRANVVYESVVQSNKDVVLIGMCAGATAACHAAEKSENVQGVVCISPYYDEKYPPMNRCPTLHMFGEKDKTFPSEYQKLFWDHLSEHAVILNSFCLNTDHKILDSRHRNQVFEIITDFIQSI